MTDNCWLSQIFRSSIYGRKRPSASGSYRPKADYFVPGSVAQILGSEVYRSAGPIQGDARQVAFVLVMSGIMKPACRHD